MRKENEMNTFPPATKEEIVLYLSGERIEAIKQYRLRNAPIGLAEAYCALNMISMEEMRARHKGRRV